MGEDRLTFFVIENNDNLKFDWFLSFFVLDFEFGEFGPSYQVCQMIFSIILEMYDTSVLHQWTAPDGKEGFTVIICNYFWPWETFVRWLNVM